MARGMKEIKPQIKSEEAIPFRMALASTTKLATRGLLWLCRKHDKNARLWLGDCGITSNWHLGTAECYRPECLSNLCGLRSAREYRQLQEVQSRTCLPRGASLIPSLQLEWLRLLRATEYCHRFATRRSQQTAFPPMTSELPHVLTIVAQSILVPMHVAGALRILCQQK